MINYLKTIDIDNTNEITFNSKTYKIYKMDAGIYNVSTDYFDMYVIKIKNKLIELNGFDIIFEYEECSEKYYYDEFKVIKNNDEYVEDYTTTSMITNKPISYCVKYYCTFQLDNNHKLGINIDYLSYFDTCIFNKNISCYVLTNDMSKKYLVEFSDKDLLLLNELYDMNNNSADHIKLFNLKLQDLINNNDNLMLFNVFKNFKYDLIMKNINVLINPILEQNNITAYFKNFPSFFDRELIFINADNNINFIRKAEAVSKFLTGDTCIDIFTGKILEYNFEEIYRDIQYLIIAIPTSNIQYVYEKIDNIFCLIKDYEDINEAINRYKLIAALS